EGRQRIECTAVLLSKTTGRPIYKASSLTSFLAAFEGCLNRYESLHTKAGMFQGDISPSNLMVNEEDNNPL
ncbi:hypothetical protein BU26DRAFT_578938, partial [Trematosphaeria pertusa]